MGISVLNMQMAFLPGGWSAHGCMWARSLMCVGAVTERKCREHRLLKALGRAWRRAAAAPAAAAPLCSSEQSHASIPEGSFMLTPIQRPTVLH